MAIKREKVLDLASTCGAKETAKGLWLISSDDLEKLSQQLIEEHQNRLPKWMQATGFFCAITGLIFWAVAAACRAHDVDRRETANRLGKGWSVDEAFGFVEKKRKLGPVKVVIDGVEYRSLSQAEKALGTSAEILKKRHGIVTGYERNKPSKDLAPADT